ncbi:hypothetical protein E4U54_002593 [Claviceps lovelessii]|nr:hypothetical protein E4U54_002593 [Claviceps lovelessii]
MKFTTTLSGLALVAFANSQPLVARSDVEARDDHYCCVISSLLGHENTGYVKFTGGPVTINQVGNCRLVANQMDDDVSQGYCNGWTIAKIGCDDVLVGAAAIVPASECAGK